MEPNYPGELEFHSGKVKPHSDLAPKGKKKRLLGKIGPLGKTPGETKTISNGRNKRLTFPNLFLVPRAPKVFLFVGQVIGSGKLVPARVYSTGTPLKGALHKETLGRGTPFST